MSEARKRLNDKPSLPHWIKEYKSPSVMEDVIELNKKVVETKSQEERVKEELKHKKEALNKERTKIIDSIITTLEKNVSDESSDANKYKEQARLFAAIPTAENILRNIAFQEEQHEKLQRDLIYRLKETKAGRLAYWEKRR